MKYTVDGLLLCLFLVPLGVVFLIGLFASVFFPTRSQRTPLSGLPVSSSPETPPRLKYSLRSLMIAVMVLPPLLAGGYFALLDHRLIAIAIGLIVGGGVVVAALACLVAMEKKLNEMKENWRGEPKMPSAPNSSAPARVSPKKQSGPNSDPLVELDT